MKNTILSHLPGDFPWQVQWFDTIDSTNDQAKIMARNGTPHGTVLVAGHQSKGRGRMGRSFSSPEGKGIYLSIILRPNCAAGQLMHLTCAAAIAMCDAVESTTGLRPGIKWINDLVVNEKKLGGILTELSMVPGSNRVQYAIVGIGINCSQAQEDFPEEIRHIATSLLTAAGKAPERSELAAAMIRALHQMDAGLLTQKDAVMAAYRQDCITLGKQIVVLRGDQKRYGTAIDIESDGGLLVQFDDESRQTVNSGEVSIRGMYGYV